MDIEINSVGKIEVLQRGTIVNSRGYLEVTPSYRMSRSLRLSGKSPDGRIRCPMIDAVRSDRAYGQLALKETTQIELLKLGRALGFANHNGLLAIAYLSGSGFSAIKNLLTQKFDDKDINSGLIISLKNDVNTGLLSKGIFSQERFSALAMAVHPHLKNKPIDSALLYSTEGSELYIYESDCEDVVSHSRSNSNSGLIGKYIGTHMSRFEMNRLLFGVLSQPMCGSEGGSKRHNGILLRDLYDFYKYGWFPAHIEASLEQEGLLKFPNDGGPITRNQ